MQTIFAVKVKFRAAIESPNGGFHTPRVRKLVFLGLCNDNNVLVVEVRKEVLDALVDADRSFVDVWKNVPHFENREVGNGIIIVLYLPLGRPRPFETL